MTSSPISAIPLPASLPPETLDAALASIVERHGPGAEKRARIGVHQVAERWRPEVDGDEEEFVRFTRGHFVPEGPDLNLLRDRLEEACVLIREQLGEIGRRLRRHADLRPEGGEVMRAVDSLLAKVDPAPDLMEQAHRQGLAFLALLNFERPSLAAMLEEGPNWDADRWVEARIAQAFGARIPRELSDRARGVRHAARQFVAEFHVPVGTLVDETGRRWLEPERRLLAHWLIREQIKAHYGDPEGLARQRALMHVMRRAIEGTVPSSVMAGKDDGDWDPARNTVGGQAAVEVCGLERYERLLDHFHLARALDAHHPAHPTAIARKFELEREMSEEEVEQLLVGVLAAPERRAIGERMSRELGRPLEAHDVYLEKLGTQRSGAEWDRIVARHYADEGALEEGLPSLLRELGYPETEAEWLARSIRVEIARGAGHAVRPSFPGTDAWLRTNRAEEGLGWDGFDTAMHELGHSLEQLISTNRVERPILRGVPNTACTEAFAFLYQSLAPRVLGVGSGEGGEENEAAEVLLECAQIAGPSLLELHTWRWLYRKGDASPEALRDAMLAIARELWTEYYEAIFGPDPYHTLAAYQHMVAFPLYLPDYPLGHIMSYQVRAHMRGRDLAEETLRICSLGQVTPDLWIRRAVGGPVSIDALRAEAAQAVDRG